MELPASPAPDVTSFDLTLEAAPRFTLGMGRMRDGTKIGELAARCGVSRDTIRFYEREGLLPQPKRTPTLYRVYGDHDERRLLFIRQAQALGLTLDDIRELVRLEQLRTPGECRKVAALLRERIKTIDRKVTELRAFRSGLAESLERCEKADGESCPVVLSLSSTKGKQRKAW
jgi:MerR family copper efflux transcriptional regulator